MNMFEFQTLLLTNTGQEGIFHGSTNTDVLHPISESLHQQVPSAQIASNFATSYGRMPICA